MAYKMVISGVNVIHILSSGFSTINKLPAETTLNIPARAGDDMVMQAHSLITGQLSRLSTGYLGIELFDKDNESTAAVEFKGKLGEDAGDHNGVAKAFPILFVKAKATESISALTSSQGVKIITAELSPTNYSTGKIVWTFSGKLTDGSSMLINPHVEQDPSNPTVYDLGQIIANEGVSGHVQIICEFSIQTV